MPARHYPFVDIAVHKRVRERFCRGEAMALFSRDLNRILWANGKGAELFGFTNLYDLLDTGVDASDVSFRQLKTTALQLTQLGQELPFVIRIASGFQLVAMQATTELIALNTGEEAVLLSVPADLPTTTTALAQRMLQGLDDPQMHMAVVGDDGAVLASSAHFAALGITQQTIADFVTLAAQDADLLIKRPLLTGKGSVPAAIGKLGEDSGFSLLFVVETALDRLETTNADQPHTLPSDNNALDVDLRETSSANETLATNTESDDPQLVDLAETGDELSSDHDIASDETASSSGDVEEPVEPSPSEALAQDPDAPASDAPQTSDALKDTTIPQNRSLRFVWKIDVNGRFSDISPEFAQAVGSHVDRMIGESFADVINRFHLDPDGTLSEILARHDTWSGITVLWPVENTGFVVPVDLAALPTYTREREFDGFRGFGVVRLGDRQDDPLERGLDLDGFPNDMRAPLTEDAPADVSVDEVHDDALVDETPEDMMDVPSSSDRLADIAPPSPPEPYDMAIVSAFKPRLTASEEANFEEIGKRLKVLGTSPKDQASEAPTENHADDASAETSPSDLKKMPEPAHQQHSETVPIETIAGDDSSLSNESDDQDQPEIQAAFSNDMIPPRSQMTQGLSAQLLDQLPIATLIHVGATLIYANPEFLKLTRYPSLAALEAVGGIEALLHHVDDSTEETAGHNGAVIIAADDTLVPVTARLQSVRWNDSHVLMLTLVPAKKRAPPVVLQPVTRNSDIDLKLERMTERVAKLQVEVEELQSILETATDGVVVIGVDGDIRSINHSASALFNYNEDEVRGKPFVMLFAHESQQAVLDYLHGLAEHGVASVLNDGRAVIGQEASGGYSPLFMTMGRLTSSNGYCAVIRDITQWKRTEEELLNAKKAAETANAHKSDFLARVSHEIRTPLNAIIGFSDMMATEKFGPVGHSRYIEYANDIGRSGRYVLDIVNDLLDISKIEAGGMELEFAAVALNEVIAEAVALVQPQANGERVIVRTAFSPTVPEIVADIRSVKQIAINILSNAIRFTPAGGQIVVSTAYEANGGVKMRVRDTGIGMTHVELDQAMKPFQQVTAHARPRGEGTGLGLPLTKALAEANRAIFSISSQPKEGTLVEIAFPPQRVLAR